MMKPTYTLQAIANGATGIRQTLKIMSAVTNKYKAAPAIRELALRLVSHLPQKGWKQEALAIHTFVRDHIRYVKDIRGVETIQTPIQTLRLRQGDCDDKSILSAALLEALGHPTKFVAVGFQGNGSYNHVFTQTKIGNNWITLETTEPWPMGKTCPGIKNKMQQHN